MGDCDEFDQMNASQMLHMALQKMDDIIAINPDLQNHDQKSDLLYKKLDSSDLKKLNCIIDDSVVNIDTIISQQSFAQPTQTENLNRKQEKLNQLLQELKDYSREDVNENFLISNDVGESVIENLRMENLKFASNNENNFNSNDFCKTPNTDSESYNENESTTPRDSIGNEKSTPSIKNQRQFSLEKQSASPVTQDDLTNRVNDNQNHHKHQSVSSRKRNTNGDQYMSCGSQQEKIIQLESMLQIFRSQLTNTEDLFKKALVSKNSLEKSNCDLLSVIDKLKLDSTQLKGRHKVTKEINNKLETEIESLKTRLLEKETEISSLRLTMAKIVRSTGYVLSENELALLRGKTIASDFIKHKFKDNYHELRPHLKNSFYSEPSSRRESISNNDSFGVSNERLSPAVQARNQSNQSSPIHVQIDMPKQEAEYSLMSRSTSFEDMKMISENNESANQTNGQSNHIISGKPYRGLPRNSYSTMPCNSKSALRFQKNIDQKQRQLSEFSNENKLTAAIFNDNESHQQMSQSLYDEPLNIKAFSTPASPMVNLKATMHSSMIHPTPSGGGGVTFGKKFFWLKKSRRTASAPELAKDDEIILPSLQSSKNELNLHGIHSPKIIFDNSKPKGLRRIFSRKRSTSSLSGISDAFSRGGFRATSGPRIGFSQEKRMINVNLPFSQWDKLTVADWFAIIGLGMYVNECKRWCKNGEHLMRVTSLEVEKELGIKNPLHRKKLRLAVASMNDEEDELLKNAGKLDYLWVARWLDDIGLPQYKDAFIDARIDGRVLHYLTIEDLLNLKITSQLHFASIRAGIRVLRENKYNSQCLKRRASSEESTKAEWNSFEVSLWSSHRVMEWLRSIDLSEYAPNLRGSGVHGALILYENGFNSDLFSTLLSIPTSKTLLRRHISSKFKQLIGDKLTKIKRDYECLPNYQPMIPGSKIKAHKKGHFILRRKRTDFELTDYVCPMTPISSHHASLKSISGSLVKESSSKNSSIVNLKSQQLFSSSDTAQDTDNKNGNNTAVFSNANHSSESKTEKNHDVSSKTLNNKNKSFITNNLKESSLINNDNNEFVSNEFLSLQS